MRALDEYKFRSVDHRKKKHVGQGDGQDSAWAMYWGAKVEPGKGQWQWASRAGRGH